MGVNSRPKKNPIKKQNHLNHKLTIKKQNQKKLTKSIEPLKNKDLHVLNQAFTGSDKSLYISPIETN